MNIFRDTLTGDNSYTAQRVGGYTCSVTITSVASSNSNVVKIAGILIIQINIIITF